LTLTKTKTASVQAPAYTWLCLQLWHLENSVRLTLQGSSADLDAMGRWGTEGYLGVSEKIPELVA